MESSREIAGVVVVLCALALMGIGLVLGVLGRYKRTDAGFMVVCAACALIAVGMWAAGGWELGLFGFVGIVGIWLPLYRRSYWK